MAQEAQEKEEEEEEECEMLTCTEAYDVLEDLKDHWAPLAPIPPKLYKVYDRVVTVQYWIIQCANNSWIIQNNSHPIFVNYSQLNFSDYVCMVKKYELL